MVKDLRRFICFLFVLPIVPTAILYTKVHSLNIIYICIMTAIELLAFISLFSIGFARALKRLTDSILKFLGKYLAIITLFFGYVLIIIPTSIVMKLTGRDRLKLKTDEKLKSYWLKYENVSTDYERQY